MKTEMAWDAYCITEQAGLQGSSRARRPFAIESLKGVNDAPVLAYPSGDFAVIVSEHSPSQTLTQQAIVEHARVISECFRTLTVLPFRFGTIFDSDDPSVRDYIHVLDIANAHVLAMAALEVGHHDIVNLGNGSGFSVQEVAEAVRNLYRHQRP